MSQNTDAYISQAILEKRGGTHITSACFLRRKGVALAIGTRIVLMVAVNDIGVLQGDWQRIHFTAKSFACAVIRAVYQKIL